MTRLKRALLASLLLIAFAGVGGCCCSPCGRCGGGGDCGSCGCCSCGLCDLLCQSELPDDYRGAGSYWCDCGCGELYLGDWHSCPPECDPCDCCGNYIGPQGYAPWQLPPRFGTVGRAPPPPTESSRPSVAPPPPTAPSPSTPGNSARRKRASSVAVRASYDAPQESFDTPKHCPTGGN
jgi:hypothetical protein